MNASNTLDSETGFKVTIEVITSVVQHPNSDNLGISKLTNGKTIISSKLDNGEFRYRIGSLMLYCPENAILPEKLLRLGYWDEEKNKGLLAGSKGNRVKPRKMAGIISEGIMFPIYLKASSENWEWGVGDENGHFLVSQYDFSTKIIDLRNLNTLKDLLEIEEYIPENKNV